MKCDLCKHEEVHGKLLCKTCSEMLGRLYRISLMPEPAEKPATAAESHTTAAGAMF